MIDTRPLRWGLALALGCSLLCGSALANTAHDDHAPHGKAKKGKGAPVETEVQRLVHRYDSAQVVVVKGAQPQKSEHYMMLPVVAPATPSRLKSK